MSNYELLMGLKVLFWIPIVIVEWFVVLSIGISLLVYFIDKVGKYEKQK